MFASGFQARSSSWHISLLHFHNNLLFFAFKDKLINEFIRYAVLHMQDIICGLRAIVVASKPRESTISGLQKVA